MTELVILAEKPANLERLTRDILAEGFGSLPSSRVSYYSGVQIPGKADVTLRDGRKVRLAVRSSSTDPVQVFRPLDSGEFEALLSARRKGGIDVGLTRETAYMAALDRELQREYENSDNPTDAHTMVRVSGLGRGTVDIALYLSVMEWIIDRVLVGSGHVQWRMPSTPLWFPSGLDQTSTYADALRIGEDEMERALTAARRMVV